MAMALNLTWFHEGMFGVRHNVALSARMAQYRKMLDLPIQKLISAHISCDLATLNIV